MKFGFSPSEAAESKPFVDGLMAQQRSADLVGIQTECQTSVGLFPPDRSALKTRYIRYGCPANRVGRVHPDDPKKQR
jgi:hypothetical protein